jgi:phenylacetate-CoA ligase
VHCELQPRNKDASEHDRREIAGQLQHRIKTVVGVSTRVVVLEPDSIERTLTGKARRVIDSRPR